MEANYGAVISSRRRGGKTSAAGDPGLGTFRPAFTLVVRERRAPSFPLTSDGASELFYKQNKPPGRRPPVGDKRPGFEIGPPPTPINLLRPSHRERSKPEGAKARLIGVLKVLR